ncbi:Predicted metal-dependent hydrolase of the TIM-barrel fold [Actinomadura madurae]|nr:Predicted metal-dependent hydrolase of the TIM-barrel fold [Actinomadura madurae]
MIDGIPVIDAVVHPYNLTEENFRTEHARAITAIVSGGNRAVAPPGYRLPKDGYERNWSIEEVANMSFVESYADLAVYHVVPIRAFHDGICSVEKGLEAQERWPDRFLFYVGVDPMEGTKAIEDLERQVELFDRPIGLKLYPNSWVASEVTGWLMDDPEVAFPLFERARQLGIKTVAVHKAIPLGPVELKHYRVDDIDRAAMAFPDLNFEIVHGGMAFLEETAWQLARFRNVWVNLESTATMLTNRPGAFERAFAALVAHGGPRALSQIVWGTGCMVAHPRPHLENFARNFAFSPETVERSGLPEITDEVRRDVLARNYARLHGIDLAERLNRIKGDAFDLHRPDGTEPPAPYSTTAVADVAY